MKGRFITLEGPDGSGKTTVATALCRRLEEKGIPVVHTREPGGIEISEAIRNIILDPKNTMMDAKTEALLYAASRRQHLVEKVFPAVEAGKIVICERFLDSSLAYQGYGRQLGFDEVLGINLFAIDNTYPDLTIYLDIDEQAGLDRLSDREFKDRLDQESIEFHHRVSAGYREVLSRFKDRIRIVDASMSKEEVISACEKLVLDLIND
ncbi:MAG: dTMP kinase [Erysipelotrichaceae bacterium]|jgi:dTMP kinase|nr:dTMP kinase [Erysipelotrichaceae bacterium]MCR5096214.1 dTMP kinase [Erysipelotrichaceae bacterium]